MTLVAGVGLIFLGLAWQQLYPPTSYWGSEKAKQLEVAAAEAHNLQHVAEDGGSNGAKSFAEAKARYDKLQSELEYARKAHDRTGSYLAAVGASLVFAGIWIYLKVPPAESDYSGDRRH
jgi:hypothetical protein